MESAGRTPLPDLSSLRIHRDARPVRRRRVGWIAALLLLAALGAAGWLLRERIPGLEPAVEVGVVVITGPSADNALVTANGYVVPRYQAGVTPKVTGRIEALHADLGDEVKKDQVLAVLENRDLLAALEEAQATLWVAELTAERDRKLAVEKITPQQEADLSQARAKEAAARVKNLEEQVENTRVRAPFDGRVIVKNGEVGETVSLFGGQTSRKAGPIFVVADFREMEVEADVNESNIGKVAEGQPAEVVLPGAPGKKYRGRLRQVVPSADRQKATVQVKVTILDPDRSIIPEMTATVNFLKEEAPAGEAPRVVAPAEGIVSRDGRKVAFVLPTEKGSEQRVRQVEVEAHQGQGGRLVVERGLRGGESIVISPPPGLSDGDKVRVKTER